MKNTFKLLAVLAAFGFAGAANAQSNASATATASARIITPISLHKDADLNFGSIVPSGDAGTVTVNSESRSNTGGVSFVNQSSSWSAAHYTVAGEPTFTYNISFDGSFNISDGTHDMGVSTSGPSSGTLDASGNDNFYIGGTLSVPANATPGTYTATFNTTVAYN